MSIESASDRARRLIDEVKDRDKANYTSGEVRNILNAIAQTSEVSEDLASVEKMRRGDVFIAKLVGGKVRPWVTISVKSGLVVAVAMSSGDSAPRMEKSRCRLWPKSWVGTTVALFSEEFVRDNITRPYTNREHLRAIEANLASLMGLRVLK